MSILEKIKPKEKNRIYDMVRDAGVDVADWENTTGYTAANPKYCYNWSFIQPNQVIVLNLWHCDLEEDKGVITYSWNAKDVSKKWKGVTATRATNMDEAIQLAYQENLPVRVVLCEGIRRNHNDPKSAASKVTFRSLDPELWHVAEYDITSGQTKLMRGLRKGSANFVDQFDLRIPLGGPAEKIKTTTTAYVRRPEVRRYALLRANGKCEYCGQAGFSMANGQVYLETHHVVPLHEKGIDSIDNVVALCPNHHREAHHGKNRADIRKILLEKLDFLILNNWQ